MMRQQDGVHKILIMHDICLVDGIAPITGTRTASFMVWCPSWTGFMKKLLQHRFANRPRWSSVCLSLLAVFLPGTQLRAVNHTIVITEVTDVQLTVTYDGVAVAPIGLINTSGDSWSFTLPVHVANPILVRSFLEPENPHNVNLVSFTAAAGNTPMSVFSDLVTNDVSIGNVFPNGATVDTSGTVFNSATGGQDPVFVQFIDN